MLCPSCHTNNRDTARFCKVCGHALAVEAVVPDTSLQQEPVADPPPPQISSAQPAPGPSPTDEPAHVQPAASADPLSADDPSLAPTQILTPDQMMAYHSRRWRQEAEHEKQQKGSIDVADAPTLLIHPSAGAQPPSPADQDVAEMPTILMNPENQPQSAEATVVSSDSVPPPPPPPAATETSASVPPPPPPQAPADADQAADEAQQPPTQTEVPPVAPLEEKNVEHSPSVDAQQKSQDFPVLPVGTTLADRYEVTNVISDTDGEHVYEVNDQKGYLHCWNCGSEENAAGDEFCNDCGAELLNATYLLHEYSSAASQQHEANVLRGAIVNTFVEQGRTFVVEQPQTLQSAFPNGVHLLAAGHSDAGMLRRADPNEDSTLVVLLERVHESVASPAGIFLVADGMGGHDNGQGASRMTVATIAERIVRDLLMPPLTTEKAGEQPKALDEEHLLSLLHGAIQDANTAICQLNQHDKSDMGSTLTGFMVVGDHAYVFNVGDSRTYMLRDQKLYQLTTDHSLVGQLVAGGLIEPDDVYTHPQRTQIYRSIGDKLNVQIDIIKQQIHPGDIILSCSDGLWEMVRDPQITDILNAAPDPHSACSQLIEAANANGGEDNVSAVIVFVK